ncbi:MAG TPA: S4 domain-containing protein [Vicinamibacterales bacterium]|nr:S4 domain-containing protein [Vicinamibacterales bacterium]
MTPEPLTTVRIDIWLDVACLFRTRSEAQKACKAGKVSVNGQPSKPHREIKSGDEIEISRPLGRKQRVIVYAVADKHMARKDARALYEDVTPQPTREEIEQRRIDRLARAFMRPQSAGSPDKRERRQLRKMKEGN